MPAIGEGLPQGTNEEHAAAARIQAVHRGKQGRKVVEQKRASAAGSPELAAAPAEDIPVTDEQHSAAARIQAAHRGKQARKVVQEKRVVEGVRMEVQGALFSAVETGELLSVLRPDTGGDGEQQQQEHQQPTADEEAAAIRIQAAHRGKQARKVVKEKHVVEGVRMEVQGALFAAVETGELTDVLQASSPPIESSDQGPVAVIQPAAAPEQASGGAEVAVWHAAPQIKKLQPQGGTDALAQAAGDASTLAPPRPGGDGRRQSRAGSKSGGTAPADQLIKVKGLDKQQLCVDLLMVGCVQSFVDFFYITHRKAAPVDGSSEQGPSDVEIPEQTLVFLKETLETAEGAHRAENYKDCFESYGALAEYFEKVPDLKSGMYFHQRCADVASEVDARDSIAKANLSLGTCEEKAGHWHSAMQFHEKALQIATAGDSLPLQIRASSRLTHVYQVLAEKSERESRDSDATAYYERCLMCAQLSKDAELEGSACHRLGLSLHKTGKYDPAIELQKQYLDICRVHEDRAGESAARAALARAFEATGSTQEAIRQLESLLGVASEAGELKAQASACLNLGILYNGRGDHEKSVELLEQHFDLARQIGDRRLIDSARVVLGMVRGSGKMQAYVGLVSSDLDKLLKWKSKRQLVDVA